MHFQALGSDSSMYDRERYELNELRAARYLIRHPSLSVMHCQVLQSKGGDICALPVPDNADRESGIP